MSQTGKPHPIQVGVGLIDCDHRELARRLEAVESAVANGDRSQIAIALLHMQDFALTHFGLEESMMTAMHYPGFAEHLSNHQGIVDAIARTIANVQSNHSKLTRDTLRAIADTHSLHIRTDDVRLGAWLNTNGH